MMASVNKSTIVDAVAEASSLSKKDAESVIDALFDEITKQLQKGNKIMFTGFGAFKVSDRKARQGINPKTMEKIQIPAMKVPKFSAGNALKEAVN